MSPILEAQTGFSKIPFDSIKPAKEFDETEFGFFNPRILDAKNRESYGFSEEEINSLKKSIQTKGLMESFHVNLIEGEYILIDGHRRHEAISQLIQENASCYDRITNQYVSAKDIYSNILVTVHHGLNPSQCFSRAFESDSNKISFGENASIRFIDYCVSFNMSENKILEMCGKSITWLKNIIKLLRKVNVDKDIKSALIEGKINSVAANSLMDIEDENERSEVFAKAMKKAEEDYNAKIIQQDKNIKNTSKKIRKAEKMKKEAEIDGDIKDIEDADSMIEKHASKLEDRKRERNDITPRINSKNIEDAIDDIDSSEIENKSEKDNEDSPKLNVKITMKSIRDKWQKEISSCISRGHMTDEHESITPILNNCFADMIKAMFDEKISYHEFIYRWSTRFSQAGLPDNAGENVDTNEEVE